jgi:RNA polymerase sigma-70 factor (ECF subfamily)
MSLNVLSDLIQKNDKTLVQQVFELYYGKLAGIAMRYSKNVAQADLIFYSAFEKAYAELYHLRNQKNPEPEKILIEEFIIASVEFIKSIRSEYYLSSTVYAIDKNIKNHDLFENNDLIDFNKTDVETIIKALQILVPAQRLIFNLHVIDGFSIQESAFILETSEETVKSNLEKARFNLQKNIEKKLKGINI